MAGRATSTSAATASSTWSPTFRPQATPRMSSCRTYTASRRCWGAGSWAPTKARSATTSSTTTSTSSPSASTDAAHVTAGCSSTGCSRARWPPIPTLTGPSPANRPHDQPQSQIGGAKRIAHSRDRNALGVLPVREGDRDGPATAIGGRGAPEGLGPGQGQGAGQGGGAGREGPG